MENNLEYHADSFAKFYAENIVSEKSAMQLYNTWVSRQSVVPGLDVAEQIIRLIKDLREQKKIKKEYLVQILSN